MSKLLGKVAVATGDVSSGLRRAFPVLDESRSGPEPFTPADGGDDRLLDSYSKTIVAVVNRVAPSVVNIRVAA